jgi:NADH:ubiquinone oxidoreductase subunit 4 (subunit M)
MIVGLLLFGPPVPENDSSEPRKTMLSEKLRMLRFQLLRHQIEAGLLFDRLGVSPARSHSDSVVCMVAVFHCMPCIVSVGRC